MLKLAEIASQSAIVTRKVTSPGQGIVMIDCELAEEGESEQILSAPLHWRVGDWSKPPINITLNAETGRFQSLQLVLQDETITHLPSELTALVSKTGIPIFERTLWNDDEYYVDEHLQPTLNWSEQNSLLVVFIPALLVQTAQACLVDDSLTLLFNEQNEIIGFWLHKITRDEKRIIRWAVQ